MGVYDTSAFRDAYNGGVLGREGSLRMNGQNWVAQARLTNKAGDVLALPGETCERVPEPSLYWLMDQGLIVPASVDIDGPPPAWMARGVAGSN